MTSLKFVSGSKEEPSLNLIVTEFWLIGGCWSGKLMLWTAPSNENDYTVLAKCKVGHKSDILCVESSSQFIASGGIDGLLSVWNLFSGTLKFAIELPPPKLLGQVEEIKDFNYLSTGTPKRSRSISGTSDEPNI